VDADPSGFRKVPQRLQEVIRLTPSTGERAAIQNFLDAMDDEQKNEGTALMAYTGF
jgi:hypothetical protein